MTKKKIEDKPKSYITASIESKLHKAISAEAKLNDISFSKQVLEYRDYFYAGEQKIINFRIQIKELEEQVDDLRAELKATKEKIIGMN